MRFISKNDPSGLGASGFSLVEVMVALVVLGVMLGVGVSRIDYSAWALDSAVKGVSQHLRVARQRAVMKQHDVIVSFDVAEATLVLHEDANNNGVQDGGERVSRRPLEKEAIFSRGTAPVYAGFIGGPVTFTGNQVIFHRNGSASEEGAIYVGRNVNDEHSVVIVLRRATAYTETFKHTGSWQENG